MLLVDMFSLFLRSFDTSFSRLNRIGDSTSGYNNNYTSFDWSRIERLRSAGKCSFTEVPLSEPSESIMMFPPINSTNAFDVLNPNPML